MFRRLAEVDTLSRSFVALSLEKSYAGATVADNGKNLFSDCGGCRNYHILHNPPAVNSALHVREFVVPRPRHPVY